MDNRTLLAILLSLAIWYTWLILNPPEPPLEGPPDAETVTTDAPSASGTAAADGATLPPVVPAGPETFVDVTMCGMRGRVSSRDGALRALELEDQRAAYDVVPLWQWALTGFSGPWQAYDEPGPEEVVSARGQVLSAGTGGLTAPSTPVTFDQSRPGLVVSRGVTADGIEVVRELREVPGDPCRIEASVTWRNPGSSAYVGDLWVGVHDVLSDAVSRYAAAVRPRARVAGSVEAMDDLEELLTPQPLEGAVSWFGLADTYFAALLVPSATTAGSVFGSVTRGAADAVAHGVHFVLGREALPAGGERSARFLLYVGPKESDALAAYEPTLADAVELGWLSALAWPLLWLLKLIHGFLGNWGLAIIALTFLIKALFFRLTQTSFRSSQAMQALSPMLAEIREKYKNDPEELNRRTMALFSENGVNPLGGCLPMLVQMPVWFALYSVLLSSVELYHTEFLYLKDLSAPDPYMVLPFIVVVLMVVQQQFMPKGQMDPTQEKMMKAMPVIFGIFFFSFPSGLVVYIFVNMVLSIAQQWYIKRTFVPAGSPAVSQG